MSQMSFGGDWTRQKLEILRRYLDAYTTALKDQPFTLIYIDAFAGDGYWRPGTPYTTEDYGDFSALLKGSARLALAIGDKPFDRFIFIEKNRQRSNSLMQLRREHPTRDINVLNRDANEALPWISKTLRALDRAVVFLDPFATQVSWSTVEALAATQKVDCWVLFPISAVTRQLRREDLPLSEWQAGLDRVFGGGEYWEGLYSQQLPLLDDGPRYERYRDSQQIASKYRDRLRGSFHTVAPTQRTLRNSTNSPMFELFFAASNPRGAPIAVDIADHLLRNW